jgi:dTDP-4-dehydrorhamnose reductase
MQRVAIFGSAGQLGIELTAVFAARNYQVDCFARNASATAKAVDITDTAAVEEAITSCQPSLVLNAAAYNTVDLAEAEPIPAFANNALAVRNLALACKKVNAKLVHYSTDYVFDGCAGRSYGETDATRPLGAYAVSKLAGEQYAAAYLDDVLIIRTSAVYGPAGVSTQRGNFVELMLRLARSGKPIQVVDDHVASPTYAPALAVRTADLIALKASGVFHIGGGTPISWYEWARMIFAAAGVTPDLSPTSSASYPTAARRPEYSALSNSKMESLGVAPMPALQEALQDYMMRRG